MEKDETRLQETQTTGKKAVREKLRMKQGGEKWKRGAKKGKTEGKKRWQGRGEVVEPRDTTVDPAAGRRC